MPKAVRELLQSRSYDEPDRMPKNISITNLDLIMYVVAIVGHLVDLGIDVNVAVRYYLAGYMEAFGWTLVFILLPAFVNTAVSIRMYSQDKQQDSFTNEVTKRHWLRVFILVLQMAPILRFTDALIYAIKSRRAERNNDPASQRLYYSLMLKEDSDAALLRIFECFLEAAPQLVLQITLVLQGRQQEHTVHQALSISSSLVSLGWCLAAYQRAVRFAQEDKTNVTWLGTAMQTVWHYLLTLSRVTSIAIIAYLYPYWTVLACAVHVLAMTAWIQLFDRPIFCSQSRTSEIAFSFALGAVYLFTYILSVEAKTRYRYSIYYTLCLLQNVTCGLLWVFYVEDIMRESNAFYAILILCIVPYLVGLFIMILYYAFFHPNLKKREDTISVAFKINDQVFDVIS